MKTSIIRIFRPLIFTFIFLIATNPGQGQCTVFVETPMGEDPNAPFVDVGIGINNCPQGHLGGRIIFNDGFTDTIQTFGPGTNGSAYTFSVRDSLPPGSYFISVEVQPVSSVVLLFGGNGTPFEAGSNDFLTIGNPGGFNILNLQVSPGMVDVASSGKTVAFSFEAENLGFEDLGAIHVTLRPPSNQVPPIELTSNGNGANFAFDPSLFPTPVSFSQFFPVLTEPGVWAIDIVLEDLLGQTFEFQDAGGFVIQSGNSGDSQTNPILPDAIDDEGNFIFTDIPGNTSFWMDPPMAFGYVWQSTEAPRIASIDALPVGIDSDGLFTLHTPSQIYENVTVTDTFDFSNEPGGGIRWFAITDVGPVDGLAVDAFPIQVTFTAETDLCITVLEVPEATVTGTSIADPGDFRRPCGLWVDVAWEWQPELEYLLESSSDMVTWATANTGFPVDYWWQGGGIRPFSRGGSGEYFRVKARFARPVLKYTDDGGGGGPVIVTPPPPNPYFPFGPPLPPVDSFAGFGVIMIGVGDAGNAADDNGYGAVGYEFRMSQTEVSRGMVETYNSNVDANLAITMADMTSLGGNGFSQPATGISWNEAARFVNWLNTNRGFPPAYKFPAGGGVNDPVEPWVPGESGYDASNPFRNSNCVYFLPSEDEWYKTAYHLSGGVSYYDYPTGSNTGPLEVSGGTAADTAVWKNQTAPADIFQAGGLSPHGTMGQGGNVWEWSESAFDGVNDSGSEDRTLRGGHWAGTAGIHAGSRLAYGPAQEDQTVGFRIASRSLSFNPCE